MPDTSPGRPQPAAVCHTRHISTPESPDGCYSSRATCAMRSGRGQPLEGWIWTAGSHHDAGVSGLMVDASARLGSVVVAALVLLLPLGACSSDRPASTSGPSVTGSTQI